MQKLFEKLTTMEMLFIGVILGILACTLVVAALPTQTGIGAAASNGDFLGIYNATPTDMVLRDGYGSAFLTDSAGRVIATSTH